MVEMTLRNVPSFGGCSTTCQTGLLESVGPKMAAFVCLARMRLHPKKTHTMPSAHFRWVVFPLSVVVNSETGTDERKVNFFIVCLPRTVQAKLMMTTLFSVSTALLYSDAGHNIYKVFGNFILEITLTIPSRNLVSIFLLLGASCTR